MQNNGIVNLSELWTQIISVWTDRQESGSGHFLGHLVGKIWAHQHCFL